MNLQSGKIDLTQEPDFVLGGMTVHPSTREIDTDKAREAIEPRVMQVLVALTRRRGEVISRDELIVSCWSGRAVSDDAINRCIARIRRMAETHGGFVLETIPRVGYRLTELAPEPATVSPAPLPEAVPEKRPQVISFLHHHRRLTVLVLLVFMIAAGVTGRLLLTEPKQPDVKAAARTTFSIAVLPFRPLADDAETKNLGEAIATSIADTLGSEGFEVVSPTGTRTYRAGTKADGPQADFVIDGEIRREGDLLKVPVRVVAASGSTIVVADTVEVAATDLADVPEIIAHTVINYGWALTAGMKPSARRDPAVIAGSLRVINNLTNREDRPSAYEAAKQLAASAPQSAYAQMLYGFAAAAFIPEMLPERRMEIAREARAAAGRALRLDPEFGEPYGALSAATPSFNWGQRERYLRRGLRIRPMSPLVYMSSLMFMQNAGYTRESALLAQQTYTSHPAYNEILVNLINADLLRGDFRAARPLIALGHRLNPKSAWFPARGFEAAAFYGFVSDAEALMRNPATARLLQKEGDVFVHIIAAARQRRAADIQVVVDDCAVVLRRTTEFKSTCLLALAYFGKLDEAFRLAESLYPDQRGADAAEIERRWLQAIPFPTAYLFAPPAASLRADPRFRDVVERVGLLQYWQQSHNRPDFCSAEKAPVCAFLKGP